jgi:hypothetical protein
MDPSPYDVIVAIAASQWDLFTAQQAFQAGLTPAGLRWNCRPGGPFERVARGVYRLRDVPPQPCQRLGVELLAAGKGAVACHRSAGWLLGLDGVPAGLIDIAVPIGRSHTRRGRRRMMIDPSHVVPIGSFYMTDALTTLLDLATDLDDRTWEWTLESALRKKLVIIEGVVAETARRSQLHLPGAPRARRVLALRPAGARPTGSQLETEFIQLIRPVEPIPEPERQRPVFRVGRLIARLDVAFPEVCAYTEVHGPQHRESLRYDTNRETLVASTLGWLASEVTWEDVRKTPRPTINRMIDFIAMAARRVEPQTSGR